MTARPTSITSVTWKSPAEPGERRTRRGDHQESRGRRFSTLTCTPSTRKRARPRTTSRRPSPGTPSSPRVGQAFGDALGGDAVQVDGDTSTIAAGIRAAARPWGGSYCSYQLGTGGPFWVMPALGASQDEFNRRLARADGLQAEPDPRLGGAVNLVRPSLADAGRLSGRATGHGAAAGQLRDVSGPARAQPRGRCPAREVIVRAGRERGPHTGHTAEHGRANRQRRSCRTTTSSSPRPTARPLPRCGNGQRHARTATGWARSSGSRFRAARWATGRYAPTGPTRSS